jgi:LacI family transcriptional regulator
MRVRIKDIAERANVSLATVSLVLNNRPGTSRSTREKVLRIARELHYERAASFPLNSIRLGTIRFLKVAKHGRTVNRDHDVFIADYIEGLDHEAVSLGYNLEISTYKTDDVSQILQSLEHTDVKGFIVLGTELSELDVRAFEHLQKPVVFIDTYYDFLDFNFVDMNNIDSLFRIVSSFVDRGHREIGFIGTSVEASNFRRRETGFRLSMDRFGIPCREEYFFSVDSTFDGAYSDMLSILRGNPRRLPTALFCSNDIMAYGCIKAMKECGVAVPKDVSVIGFDDLPMSALMDPPLTTMRVSKGRIGSLSVLLIHQMLGADHPIPPSKITICGHLVERDSVATLKA